MSINQSIKLLTTTLLLLFNGCSSHSNYFTPYESSRVDLTPPKANIVIHDFLTIVTAYYSPAKTIFQIESTNSPFAQNIEKELRIRGYGVGAIYGKDLKQFNLAWSVNYLNKKMIQVSFQIEDVRISRVYQLKSNQYYPFSPLSATGLNREKLARLHFATPSYNLEDNPIRTFAKVKATHLKIRSKPTTQSKAIATLKRGESITYQEIITNEKGEEWVKLEGGGYMKASYLQF